LPTWRAQHRSARWARLDTLSYPIGSTPYGGGSDATPAGSRLDLAFAQGSGANALTPGARAAVRARLAAPEWLQTLNRPRRASRSAAINYSPVQPVTNPAQRIVSLLPSATEICFALGLGD